MKNAGKAGIRPRDGYDSSATYERLDAIIYNGTMYIAKKDVPQGTLPTDTEYWMKSITGGTSEIATTENVGIVKPDGTTITIDEDGTIHGQSKVDEMTGATADKDGASGTVPAPVKGQQSHILNGDGTWTSPLDNEIIAAKIEELTKAIEDAKALRASLEAYGLVKVTDSSVVTDSTGLALAATEKNAAIPGTLAHQVSQLNTDLYDLLASPYDSSKMYDIGDFCSYKNSIYQCKTKISTPESFSSDKWKQIVIGDYLTMMMPRVYCSESSSVSIDLSKYVMNYEVIIGKPKIAAGISAYIGRYWVNISNVQSASDIFMEQNSQIVSSISLSNNILNITFTSNEYHTVAIRPIKGYTISSS